MIFSENQKEKEKSESQKKYEVSQLVTLRFSVILFCASFRFLTPHPWFTMACHAMTRRNGTISFTSTKKAQGSQQKWLYIL